MSHPRRKKNEISAIEEGRTLFEGDVFMNHDIEDLLNLIKELEERIALLELLNDALRGKYNGSDLYYWEHG